MSLTPYKNSSTTTTFELAYENASGQVYLVPGRMINRPYKLEVVRKLTPPSGNGNDQVIVRAQRVEANASTGKLATMSATLIISIPKDQTVIDATAQKETISWIASLLNECTVMEATNVNITRLIEGRNLS